jgi:hypothetical protein
MSDKIGEIYSEFQLRLDKYEQQLSDAERKAERASNSIQNKLSRAKATIDTNLFKKNVAELEAMQTRLKTKLEEKLRLGMDAGSITRTKDALSSVENKLKDLRTSSDAPKKGFFSGFDGGIKSFIGSMGAAVLATATVQSAIQMLASSMDAFEKKQKALLGVEATIKSMGLEGVTSAGEIDDLANSLEAFNRYSVDDTDILDLETYLLTFDKIGKDAIPRATQVVIDLAAKMKTDLKGAALAVGIALDNPAEGFTRLSKAGVKFEKDEQEVIKSLVETGRRAEAQELIYDKLEKKIGGFARGQVTQWAAVKGAIGDYVEDIQRGIGGFIASVLLPVGEAIVSMIPVSAIDKFNALSKSVKENDDVMIPLIGRYKDLSAKTTLNNTEHEELTTKIQTLASRFPDAITQWDAYGKAIGISTEKIEQNIKKEKERLKYANSEAIAKTFNDQAEIVAKMDALQNRISGGKQIVGIGGIPRRDDWSTDEADKMNKELLALGEQLRGVQQQYKELSGETIETPKPATGNSTADADAAKERLSAERAAIAAHNKLIESRIDDDYQRELTSAKNTLALKLREISEEQKDAQTAKSLNLAANDEYHTAVESAERKHNEEIAKAIEAGREKFKALNEKYNKEQAERGRAFTDTPATIEEAAAKFDKGLSGSGRKNRDGEDGEAQAQKLFDPVEDGEAQAQKLFDPVEDAAQATAGAMTSSIGSAFDAMLSQGQNFGQAMSGMFSNMATYAVTQLARIGVQFALLSAAKAIFSGATGGFGGFLINALGGHSGGSFVGTPSGVRKAANGADFIVPRGYPNDSYPLMVESGERVQVTSAAKTSQMIDNSALLQQMKIMNANMVGRSSGGNRLDAKVTVSGKLEGQDIGLAGARAMRSYKLGR